MIINLPIFNIEIFVNNGSGTITSNMHDTFCAGSLEDPTCAYIDAVEAMILAHACEGVDVSSQSYVNGIQTVVDKISHDIE